MTYEKDRQKYKKKRSTNGKYRFLSFEICNDACGLDIMTSEFILDTENVRTRTRACHSSHPSGRCGRRALVMVWTAVVEPRSALIASGYWIDVCAWNLFFYKACIPLSLYVILCYHLCHYCYHRYKHYYKYIITSVICTISIIIIFICDNNIIAIFLIVTFILW